MVRRSIKTIALSALLSASIGFTGINASAENFEYQSGDFHQHTYYTDGSHEFMEHMAQNANYGLQWWANSEHGGERNRDGYNHYWDDPAYYPVNPILGDVEFSGGHQEMWRWQSLRDYVYPEIKEARKLYPDKVVISGLEWNVPGHEHCSTAIHQYDDTANLLSEFEYCFDRSDDDTSRDGEASLLDGFGDLSKTNDDKADAILAVEFMQALKDQEMGDAWVVPAHVERAWSYLIEDFRAWMDAGPDVAIGFEGAPGHQTSGDRGFSRGSLGGGTYGGTGFFVAKIGNVWDALSAEGRKFFHFASSDDHRNWRQGGSDFWPGEYQKIYTYIDTDAADQIQAVFDGNRSGNSWNVMGDLIDELQFTAKSKKNTAMMGQTLQIKAGDQVQIKIKVHDPNTPNNCPLDMVNPSLAQIGIIQPLNMPVLDHIDLIAGTITGNVPMTDISGETIDEIKASIVATDYGTDAAVIDTFYRNGGKDKNGYITYVINIKPENSMFIRLRGTNMPANVPFETDEMGNPLADYEANDNIYGSNMDPEELEAKLFDGEEIDTNSKLDEVAEAYADLWFYSNPIYIEVVE
jgi:hypothetical protein